MVSDVQWQWIPLHYVWKSAGKMINNTLKNVQKCFQFLYCTQTNVRIE